MPETLPLVGDYRVVGAMGEGTFSEVLKCQSLLDGKLYACKKMKQKYSNMTQVNNLREIQALRRLNPHPNVIELKEVIFDRQTGTLSLICELMNMNIYELIKDRRSYLPEARVRLYTYQLCKSLYHMHRNGIFHRDVKPENILIKDDLLKLADFGSCKSMYSKLPFTEYISTRWYRAPECLLTDGHYGHKMDMWSVGCVLFELMSLRPLFPGSNELDQISKIHDVVGTPSSQVLDKFRKIQSKSMDFNFPYKHPTGISILLKHASKQCIDLITKLCTYDPEERPSAKETLRHPYFKELREAERRSKLRLKSDVMQPELSMKQQQHQHKHYKQGRGKQRERDEFVPVKQRQYYIPVLASQAQGPPPGVHGSMMSSLTLPQLPKPPQLQVKGEQQVLHGVNSGLSTGLPSLAQSMKAGPSHIARHQQPHISPFPSLLASTNPSAKSNTMFPTGRHHQIGPTHLPSLGKPYYVQRTNQ
ncbi:PREDICTED: MAPK/MAK/MRK overlapping kinase-like isoform X2 [Amphimedon queenslandica]|uniref:Protein kinase domain-containing protein n=1 Tax=Amphimedon queenslandica TaxID=400682 RepID=A0A1X7UAV4_AMPQE|nr:PREDICTED: MAPK/MAK/MRK overlapping kinase-like isoform X2 [Amphimedon queenslandica]|eukprot:XP_011405604.1 PREDICTED: MAPK/MAK/MRK overlapping kinase-like isoform X2 [Amphimedon queenslandica]